MMNKHSITHITIILTAIAATWLMQACSSEQEPVQAPIMLDAHVSDGSTRTTTTSGVVWIWADKAATGEEYLRAWETVATMGSQRLSSATSSKEYPEDESNLTYYAIHGNFAETITEGTTAFGTPLTHSVLESSPSNGPSDLLYGRLFNVSKDASPTLPLRHLMCNLRIAVKLDDEEIDASNVRAVNVLFSDLLTTVTFTPKKVRDPSIQSDRNELVETLTEDSYRRAILMRSELSDDFETAIYSTVIVAPQHITPTQSFIMVTLTLDDDTTAAYIFRTKVDYESGRSYTYNLSLSDGSAIIFSNEKLIEWEQEYIIGTFNSFVLPPELLKDKIIEVGYDEESIKWQVTAMVLALSAVEFPKVVICPDWMATDLTVTDWENVMTALPLSAILFPVDPVIPPDMVHVLPVSAVEWEVEDELNYILNLETFRNFTTTEKWKEGESNDLVAPIYTTTQYNDDPENPDPDLQDYPY